MNVAGWDAGTGKSAMKQLVGKILEQMEQSILVVHQMQGRDIAFQRRYPIQVSLD